MGSMEKNKLFLEALKTFYHWKDRFEVERIWKCWIKKEMLFKTENNNNHTSSSEVWNDFGSFSWLKGCFSSWRYQVWRSWRLPQHCECTTAQQWVSIYARKPACSKILNGIKTLDITSLLKMHEWRRGNSKFPILWPHTVCSAWESYFLYC